MDAVGTYSKQPVVGEVSWERMIRAVEKVRERLRRAVAALEQARPYALAGGNAVAAWVSRVDEAAVRNTQDVHILLRRAELQSATAAMAKLDLFIAMPRVSIGFWMVPVLRPAMPFTLFLPVRK